MKIMEKLKLKGKLSVLFFSHNYLGKLCRVLCGIGLFSLSNPWKRKQGR